MTKRVIVFILGIRTSSKPTWTTWREVRWVKIRVYLSFLLFGKFELLCESVSVPQFELWKSANFSAFLCYFVLIIPVSKGTNVKRVSFPNVVGSGRLKMMRFSLVVRASDCQCTSCNGPGFDPSIRRHSGIWGAADEAVLNIVRKKIKNCASDSATK